jgi:hypothetical protein
MCSTVVLENWPVGLEFGERERGGDDTNEHRKHDDLISLNMSF